MQSSPRIIFGVHSFTPYRTSDGTPYGTIQVLGGSSFNLAGELVSLNGGSAKYPWAVEESTITAELAIKPKEYPNFLFELFLGKGPTDNAAETGGAVNNFANRKGAFVDGTTGAASAGVKAGAEADLKFGKYVLKALSATTFDVFAMSDVDFQRGTDKVFEDDALKITASPLTLANGAAVEVPGYGFEITGGSAVAMTAGDTAELNVRPINDKSMEVVIGATTNVFPNFGAIVIAQKRGNDEMLELDIYKLKAIGLPFALEEKAFSEAEITAQAFYDADQGGVFSVTHVTPS